MSSVFDDVVSNDGPTVRREWAMPNEWTFQINPIGELVEQEVGERQSGSPHRNDQNTDREVSHSDGLWVDPFAGQSDIADVTNDFNPELKTDYTLKADEFLSQFDDGEVDGGVLFDPPYSPRQIKEMYDDVGTEVQMKDTQSTFYSRKRDAIERICAEGATVISFGWNSVGIGKTWNFQKREILMVCHGGAHNDTICTVEDYRP